MRCILVNDANLKADTYCAYCRSQIGDSYAREIGSKFIFCDYDCYRCATQDAARVITNRAPPLNTWTLGS